ncbi:MAG TPA: ribosome biogenesis GTPase Der [Gammaproteobacteria bacterium]|nr:ribosome biogenesis GTPase Der [Gammaproteobacteria bacterium]
MIPVIAIVGRPNVGKSTLFNCLTQSRDAMVADIPGVTRDRIYGRGKVGDKPYIIIDTGGIGIDEEGVDELTAQQAEQAISESNIILFIVDARAGLMPADKFIAKKLRKLNKDLILVINKSEGMDQDNLDAEFKLLGFKNKINISASHRENINDLVEKFPDIDEENPEIHEGIKVAIVGKPNVGKSTLVNRILGEERVIVFDSPGTTRDSIFIPFERNNKKYTLIDTAGVRRKSHIKEAIEKISVVKTLQAIEEANVILFLVDARSGLTEQDLGLLGFVLSLGKALVIAINKWDGLEKYDREQIKNKLDRKLVFIDFAEIKFISALHGTGVGELFKDLNKAYDSAMKEMPTPLLTKILEKAVKQHQPPLVGGRRIKLRYAHAGGHNPPLIIIHGTQTEKLPDSYRRYLSGYYRKTLKLIGTPVQVNFKEGANPFRDKPNPMTRRQFAQRQRLIAYRKKS